MKPNTALLSALLVSLTAVGCDETLGVQNVVDPDVERVFATPAAIEQTIASGFQGCHNANANNSLMPQVLTLALESYSQLNNFFMGPRGGIPRSPVVNIRGTDGTHFANYSSLSRGGRLAANAVNALDKLTTGGGTLGSAAQNMRARAFGFFVIACNQAWLAMTFDSAGIIVPGLASDFVPPLSPYGAVMTSALALLDSAIAMAGNPIAAGTGGFPLPDTWLSGNAHSSATNFVRLLRSFKARFAAGVARTPVERAAVNWPAVIADATNGIQADFTVASGGSTGWNIGFIGSQMHVEPAWSQMSLMYFGMADTTPLPGGYGAFIAASMATRQEFLVRTPDQRWPQGATRAAQRTASVVPTGLASRPYIQNRTVQDVGGDPWGWSQYDFFRTKYIRNNSNQGPFPEFMKAENDMLAAEGYIRTGNFAAANTLIDLTRVARGQLPALTGVTLALGTPVPGGNGCVPRVPQGPAFTTLACGNIMEAMKWEKRMETAYTGFGAWYFDGRGWGDLVENTPLEYPVPFAELDALVKPYYGLGGGGKSSAAKGTYGF